MESSFLKSFTDIFPAADREWYRKVSYDDSCDIIRDNLKSAANSFISIGYYLKHIRDNRLYEQAGYASIWECASAEFGLNETAASRYISWNQEYSKNGDSPCIDDKYRDFSKSQLQEMFCLPEAVREEIRPEQTVAEIREIARQEKEKKMPSEKDIRDFYEACGRRCDKNRARLKECLVNRYGHSRAGGGHAGFHYECSSRGVSINGKEEITWDALVKAVNKYIPHIPFTASGKGSGGGNVHERLAPETAKQQTADENGDGQLPGQMHIDSFPEYLPDDYEGAASRAGAEEEGGDAQDAPDKVTDADCQEVQEKSAPAKYVHHSWEIEAVYEEENYKLKRMDEDEDDLRQSIIVSALWAYLEQCLNL